MKVFCLNLERAVERRKKMELNLSSAGIAVEYIPGIDGRSLTERETAAAYSKWRTRFRMGYGMTRGEIGCALGHLAFYRQVVDSNLGAALLLEDDVSLGSEFKAVIADVERFLRREEEPCLVQLPGLSRDLPQRCFEVDRKGLFVGVNFTTGAYAYAINQKAAEMLLRFYSPICNQIDAYSYLIKHIGLKVYVYDKMVLSVDNESESTVGAGRFKLGDGVLVRVCYKIWRAIGLGIDSILSRRM